METNVAVVSTNDVCARLKDVILEVTQLRISPHEISDDADLFEDCGVDSTGLVDLILLIEERFGVSIGEDEITLELFKRLSFLAQFISHKLSAQSPS